MRRFLRTTLFTNFAIYEPVQSVRSEILYWEYKQKQILRTSQFTNCIYGPIKCLFMLNKTDLRPFSENSIDESFIFKHTTRETKMRF